MHLEGGRGGKVRSPQGALFPSHAMLLKRAFPGTEDRLEVLGLSDPGRGRAGDDKGGAWVVGTRLSAVRSVSQP